MVSSNRQPCLPPFSTVSSNRQPCLPPGFPSARYLQTDKPACLQASLQHGIFKQTTLLASRLPFTQLSSYVLTCAVVSLYKTKVETNLLHMSTSHLKRRNILIDLSSKTADVFSMQNAYNCRCSRSCSVRPSPYCNSETTGSIYTNIGTWCLQLKSSGGPYQSEIIPTL
jgi:hypothetical protein